MIRKDSRAGGIILFLMCLSTRTSARVKMEQLHQIRLRKARELLKCLFLLSYCIIHLTPSSYEMRKHLSILALAVSQSKRFAYGEISRYKLETSIGIWSNEQLSTTKAFWFGKHSIS